MVLHHGQGEMNQRMRRVDGICLIQNAFRAVPVSSESPGVLDFVHNKLGNGFGLQSATEIRVIDCDSDLDLTPVQRVAHMLNKGYLYGSHYLPHDAMATQKSGKTFLNELNEVGLRNCKAVPRILDVWVGINRLRQVLPRFSFRIPACERLIEALSNYHTVRASSTGLALDEPVHDWASHFSDSCRAVAEAEAAGMLHSAGSTANVHRCPVTIRTGFRGDDTRDEAPSILIGSSGRQGAT